VPAAEWLTDRVGIIVDIPSPGVPLEFGHPGAQSVVLVHDWYGRLPWLEAYADGLVHAGFHVLVPDLYDGRATADEDSAEELMRDLDLAYALATIADGVQQARTAGASRVGLIGFSMGGWLALLEGQAGTVDAIAAYYATVAPEDHGVIPCPVLLNFAEEDEWGDGEEPEQFIGRLKEHGTPVVAYTYPGTVHSFANASIPAKLSAQAAGLAFARTASFLKAQLID
jgi:carboxymethylenebutenolidase